MKTKPLLLLDILIICQIILLIIICTLGVCSFSTTHSYEIINQYGDTVQMHGYGIYSHDSAFKAPILIGSDYTMLFLVTPLLIVALILNRRYRSVKTANFLASVHACVTYYATSIVFGVSYNSAHLPYIALFSVSFYSLIIAIKNIDVTILQKVYATSPQSKLLITRGLRVFLLLSGIALIVAWLPDIISSIFSGTSLSLIEVYTTEITYVLDMGIVSPMIFICLYLLQKKSGQGIVLLSMILTLCGIIGIMVFIQSLFQTMAAITIPIETLITKLAVFVVLAIYALYYLIRLYKIIHKTV